MSGITFKQN